MSETDKPFTVSDRRHFAPDGRPRTDGDAAAESPAAGARPPGGEALGPEPGRAPGAPAVADFSQFLLGLGAQAGILLSGDRGDTGREEALQGAQSIIAILEMLKDKTEGRRSEAEDALLEDLLFQLRMAYVEAARGGSA
jgi:hypothetical protein